LNAFADPSYSSFSFTTASARNPKVIIANTINGDQTFEVVDRKTVKLKKQAIQDNINLKLSLEGAFYSMLQTYTTMNRFNSNVYFANGKNLNTGRVIGNAKVPGTGFGVTQGRRHILDADRETAQGMDAIGALLR
jgi:hypothetical protein